MSIFFNAEKQQKTIKARKKLGQSMSSPGPKVVLAGECPNVRPGPQSLTPKFDPKVLEEGGGGVDVYEAEDAARKRKLLIALLYRLRRLPNRGTTN